MVDSDNTGCLKRLPAGTAEPYLLRGRLLLPRIELLEGMRVERGSRGAVVRVLVNGSEMVSWSTLPNSLVWRLHDAP